MDQELFLPVLINMFSGLVVFCITDYERFFDKLKVFRRRRFMIVIGAMALSSAFIWLSLPQTLKAEKRFSDFEDNQAINNYGCHWGCFDDGVFNGNSTISRNVLRRDEHEKRSTEKNRYYLEIKYSIVRNVRVDEPYCGIICGFSSKSTLCQDVSIYSALSFQAWHEGPVPPGIRFQLEITPARWYTDYAPEAKLRYDFTDDLVSSTERPIRIPFSQIINTSKTGRELSFSNPRFQKEIQQIAIVIIGDKNDAQGRLCIDEIEFIK